MKPNDAPISGTRVLALAVAVLPAVAAGAAALMDQSMRRPSLANFLIHSLHLVS